jgi:hypothetical protein
MFQEYWKVMCHTTFETLVQLAVAILRIAEIALTCKSLASACTLKGIHESYVLSIATVDAMALFSSSY